MPNEPMSEEQFAKALEDYGTRCRICEYFDSLGMGYEPDNVQRMEDSRAVLVAAYSAALVQPAQGTQALVEACKGLVECVRRHGPVGYVDGLECVQKARAALAAVKSAEAVEDNEVVLNERARCALIASQQKLDDGYGFAEYAAASSLQVKIIKAICDPVEEPTLEPPRPRHWADGAGNDPDTAEQPWTMSEVRMPAASYAIKNNYAVRGINVDGVKLCRSVHGHWGDQLWADQYGDTFSIAGTEWRPAREQE